MSFIAGDAAIPIGDIEMETGRLVAGFGYGVDRVSDAGGFIRIVGHCTYLPDRLFRKPGEAVVKNAAEELAEIKARLADSAKLEDMIYHIFYANPIAFARKNLVIGLQRYLLGLPLKTEVEAQRELLDGMSVEARAEWWRAKNADILQPTTTGGDGL